jgi:hypothetical protein
MFGFLLQWPTILTLAMFPVLVFMYARLARTEERTALAEFGSAYERYMRDVPSFIPRFGAPKRLLPSEPTDRPTDREQVEHSKGKC